MSLDYACKTGNHKLLKIMVSVTPQTKWKQLFNAVAKVAFRPMALHMAVQFGRLEVLRVLVDC